MTWAKTIQARYGERSIGQPAFAASAAVAVIGMAAGAAARRQACRAYQMLNVNRIIAFSGWSAAITGETLLRPGSRVWTMYRTSSPNEICLSRLEAFAGNARTSAISWTIPIV